jgi:hypothetical protein
MMHWRVTKYDPAYRNSSGAFQQEDWTSFDDIGRAFCGKILTMADYEKVEARHVSSCIHFVQEAGLSELIATDIEKNTLDFDLAEGMVINLHELPRVVRAILRCQVWCKLEVRPLFYLHFGYDYFMYVGCQRDLTASIYFATRNGLFVEDCASPYLRWD